MLGRMAAFVFFRVREPLAASFSHCVSFLLRPAALFELSFFLHCLLLLSSTLIFNVRLVQGDRSTG